MSSKTSKVVAIIAVIAIFFSAFSFYLILNTINIREQLHRQEEQLKDYKTL